jgi:hypothetical protein
MPQSFRKASNIAGRAATATYPTRRRSPRLFKTDHSHRVGCREGTDNVDVPWEIL